APFRLAISSGWFFPLSFMMHPTEAVQSSQPIALSDLVCACQLATSTNRIQARSFHSITRIYPLDRRLTKEFGPGIKPFPTHRYCGHPCVRFSAGNMQFSQHANPTRQRLGAPTAFVQRAMAYPYDRGLEYAKPITFTGISKFMTEVTRILSAIDRGDPHAAEELLPLVYDELRQLARQRRARATPGQTLQATGPAT